MSLPVSEMQSLRSAVKIAENICALPAVATQDWCDRAAAAILPVCHPSVCITLIGQIDDRGSIIRQDATGVAGAYVADVHTNVGRPQSHASVIAIDPNDANLVRVRTNLAQAHELSWAPGGAALAPSGIRVDPAERVGISLLDPHNAVVRRWDAYRLTGLILGVASIGPAGRVLVIELASSGGTLGEKEAAVLEAAMPALARRAMLAIGTDPTESAAWLTAREQVILRHLLLGKSVREIAEELGRSPHTVHDHVKSLHRKLNANSRGELVAKALGYSEILEVKPAAEKAALEKASLSDHHAEPATIPEIHIRATSPASRVL